MLILCGSLIRMMKSQALDYSSPLYGRRTAQLRLRQIPFAYYHEFAPSLSEDDLVQRYAVTGGVPKYAEMFRGSAPLLEQIRTQALGFMNLFPKDFVAVAKDGQVVKSVKSLKPKDKLQICFNDGRIGVTVDE